MFGSVHVALTEFDDGPVTVSAARVLGGDPRKDSQGKSIVELTIHEGRNRIVRRLLAHVGHPVRRLTRTVIGPVSLGSMPAGAIRDLTLDELGALLDRTAL